MQRRNAGAHEVGRQGQFFEHWITFDEGDIETVGARDLGVIGRLPAGIPRMVRGENRMFFMVNSVTLGSEQGQKVKLGIKLETYLRSAS